MTKSTLAQVWHQFLVATLHEQLKVYGLFCLLLSICLPVNGTIRALGLTLGVTLLVLGYIAQEIIPAPRLVRFLNERKIKFVNGYKPRLPKHINGEYDVFMRGFCLPEDCNMLIRIAHALILPDPPQKETIYKDGDWSSEESGTIIYDSTRGWIVWKAEQQPVYECGSDEDLKQLLDSYNCLGWRFFVDNDISAAVAIKFKLTDLLIAGHEDWDRQTIEQLAETRWGYT